MKYIDNRINANIVKLEDENNNYMSEDVEGALEEIDSKIKNIEANGYDDTQIRQDINNIKTEIGSSTLNTDAINIKSAINEVNSRIKNIEANGYDDTQIRQDIKNIKTEIGTEELTTTDQTIKGAVNEIDSQIKDIKKNLTYITPEEFGAIGDGLTDDTQAIQSAIDYIANDSVVNTQRELILTKKYKITSGFEISCSNISIRGIKGNKLIYTGDGINGNIFKIFGNNGDDYLENINIENIYIDGVNQVYKGGYSMSTPTNTHPNPIHRGLVGFYFKFVADVNIKNCTINDLYGEGIRIERSTNVNVENNTLLDVSSGNIALINPQIGYDDHGDGIVAFFSYNIRFINNTVINKRKYKVSYSESGNLNDVFEKICGRSGLEFEYAINTDSGSNLFDPKFNPPRYELLTLSSDKNTDGFGLIAKGNYVQGYTKGIHLEAEVDCIINENIVYENNIGINCTIKSKTTISNNYIYNTIGMSSQMGYNGYSGGIAVNKYAASYGYGLIVNNNILINKSDDRTSGISLGRNGVIISNNKFNSSKNGNCIYQVENNLNDIIIDNNEFEFDYDYNNNKAFFLYNSNKIKIINNLFESKNHTIRLNLDGVTDMNLSNNIFKNTAFDVNLNGNYSNINYNTFNEYNNVIDINTNLFNLAGFHNANFNDNLINVENVTDIQTIFKIESEGVYCSCFNKNNFILNENINDILHSSKYIHLSFSGNYIKNNKDDFIAVNLIYSQKMLNITNNLLENINGSILNSGGIYGYSKIHSNQGKIDANYNRLSYLSGCYFNKNQKVYVDNPTINTIGYLFTKNGYWTSNKWSSGTSYSVDEIIVNSANKVYKCTTSGTSTVEPTHTSLVEVIENDNVGWVYLGENNEYLTLKINS